MTYNVLSGTLNLNQSIKACLSITEKINKLYTVMHGLSDMYSGGTVLTVFGLHLNSVAEPRITLTVVVARVHSDTNTITYQNETDSAVNEWTFSLSVSRE